MVDALTVTSLMKTLISPMQTPHLVHFRRL
jgi:hypothetical protein